MMTGEPNRWGGMQYREFPSEDAVALILYPILTIVFVLSRELSMFGYSWRHQFRALRGIVSRCHPSKGAAIYI